MSVLFEKLRKRKEDRGLMASLRCVLVDNKKHRAWPALNRLGLRIDDKISAFVAGLFATHPLETHSGNIGTTCRAIEAARSEKRSEDSKITPTERRFQLLLMAERGPEIEGRVLLMIHMAKAQGVPVNYERLANDLRYWTDSTKTEWAAEFWTPGTPSPEGEAR